MWKVQWSSTILAKCFKVSFVYGDCLLRPDIIVPSDSPDDFAILTDSKKPKRYKTYPHGAFLIRLRHLYSNLW